jgi:hypothetical protein
MKIKSTEVLLKKAPDKLNPVIETLVEEIQNAIEKVSWPPESKQFTIHPAKKANGVKPIKQNCMDDLKENGWLLEQRIAVVDGVRPGPIDAVKKVADGRFFAMEWETGNISSSHRALNKMAVGILQGELLGGVLVLPSRPLYEYLTDRVGNFPEIAPYFPLWKAVGIKEGYLAVIQIEHDCESSDVPTIPKGTDGRALR